MAYSSCQNYAAGYFGAHDHAAAQADLDLYLFLGDYIYERRRINGETRPDPINAVGLESYRAKYRLYRSDSALQELHRLHPVVHVWDDHEVANNYTDGRVPPAAAQLAAAYRASFEWLPQMVFPRDRYRIYKRLRFGALADVFLLDERQYRAARASGGPRSMLGDVQMKWLLDGLRASRATWKIVAQQVVVGTIYDDDGRTNQDAWDGFADERVQLLGAIEQAGVQNVVFLSGDAHVFMANLLGTDFAAVAADRVRPAATEFVGGSVTSLALDRAEADVQRRAPWNRMYDSTLHGYAQLDLAPDRLVVDYLTANTADRRASTGAFARFVQPAWENRFERQAPAA
jgi:phosphodiesterase/alkaline phosphatase D-like protein